MLIVTFAIVICASIACLVRTAGLRYGELYIAHVLLSLASYDSLAGRLPPPYTTDDTGMPLGSWRLSLCPLLESQNFDYRGHWQKGVNAQRLSYRSPFFCFSSDKSSCNTNLVAVTGPGTAIGSDREYSLSDLDGDTVLLVEVRESGVHWMQPGDFDIGTMNKSADNVPGMTISGNHLGGFFVGFADGEVWFLDHDVPLGELAKFFTVEGAATHDREEILGSYCKRRNEGFVARSLDSD